MKDVEEGFADLILKKVHAAIGLDKAHFVFTGAAPIATSLTLQLYTQSPTSRMPHCSSWRRMFASLKSPCKVAIGKLSKSCRE